MIREIIRIDEELCDGCGLCVPSCHEGAIRIVGGKARLAADAACDGLGACLGRCPRGAITIERREAPAFDEAVVAQLRVVPTTAPTIAPAAGANHDHHGGCPGSRLMQFARRPQAEPACACGTERAEPAGSELTHWPVQINLLPPHAPVLHGARLLVAADCVPVALPDFHARLLRGRTVMIGCPKFDDVAGYALKLAAVIAQNQLQEIVVARMEVPCCMGIVAAVVEARRLAGVPVPVKEIIISTCGEVCGERDLPFESSTTPSHACKVAM